jgi:hypothetical protein
MANQKSTGEILNIKCDNCELEAIANYQKVWTKFKINKHGIYRQSRAFNPLGVEEPIENDNIHLCNKHEEFWLKKMI